MSRPTNREQLRRLIEDMERTAQTLPTGAAAMGRRGERERVASLLRDSAAMLRRAFDRDAEVAA